MQLNNRTIGAFMVAISLFLTACGGGTADNSGTQLLAAGGEMAAGAPAPAIDLTDPALWPDLTVASLEDPGPGRCFPKVLDARRDQVASGAFNEYQTAATGPIDFQPSYSQYEIGVLQADIVKVIRENLVSEAHSNCLNDLAEWLDAHSEYTQVDAVIGENFDPSNREHLAKYYERLKLVELTSQLAVQNHYFDQTEGVKPYRLERIPEHELVYFVPGYEPGNAAGNSVRPVTKLVCGNPVPPPASPPASPPPGTPTTTVTTCQNCGPTTTTTVCRRNCNPTTTTTRPPSTTTTTAPPCVGEGCLHPPGVHDEDGAGGDESEASQPVAENPPPPPPAPPPPAPPLPDRPQDAPSGGSGNGGAEQGDGPVTDGDSGQVSGGDPAPCTEPDPRNCP